MCSFKNKNKLNVTERKLYDQFIFLGTHYLLKKRGSLKPKFKVNFTTNDHELSSKTIE